VTTVGRRISSKRSKNGKKAVKLGPRFLRAFEFAGEKHSAQTRKASTIPYVAHLMGVASLVLEAGGDEDLAVAALLHDVVEDCGGAPMLKEVRRRFGKRVAKIVDECTDADTYPKPPWRERKEKYLQRLRKADAATRLVSAADKLNNVRSILCDYRASGESIWARFNGGRTGTLWYYRVLLDEFFGID
jgi:(p)ppGpp synthase/HD superfamily hydrolase